MADCFDLESQLAELRKQQAANEALQRQLDGEINQLDNGKKPARARRLTMVDGSKLEVDPQKFWDQVEKDAIAMGEAEIQAAMTAGFDAKARPRGSKGLFINYAKLPPTEENIGKLLEVLALRRNASEKGVELKRPYTEGVAQAQFQLVAQAYGADPRALGEAMSRKLAGIDQLPVNAYIVNRVKRDAVRVYADILEEVGDLIPLGLVDDSIKDQVANAARWAHYWEQFDNQVSRKIGQALRTRQFGDWVNEKVFMQFDKDISLLSFDEVSGGSMAAQALEYISNNDRMGLRRLATAQRLSEINNVSINKPGFMTQVHILNTYRKDNLFSSAATWLIRNPSAALVGFSYGLEDIAEGAFKYGVKNELGAMGHAARSVWSGLHAGFLNAWDSFAFGKTTMNLTDFAELSPSVISATRDQFDLDFNQTWELFLTPSYHLRSAGAGTAVTFMNLVNLGFRRWLLSPVLDKVVEAGAKVAGLDATSASAGVTPAFRLLGAGDEIIRKMAFDWKVNHEAWLRASKEAESLGDDVLPAGGRTEWIQQRAEGMTEKAVFSGLMTDEQLAQLRLRELGVTAGDIDNETLRLEMFNNLHGTPNLGDELGKLGSLRSDQVTFTQKLDDKFTQGVQVLRANPLAAWVVPVWRSPANGIKWLIGHDLWVQLPKQLYMEARQALSKADGGELAYDPSLMAQSRATALVSFFLASSTNLLWQAGVFSDGGPTNKEDRERWMRENRPYSFSISSSAFEAAKMKLDSIDLFDLMGLQADLMRAHHEGRLDNDSFTTHMGGIVTAYARAIQNKSALTGITSLMGAVARAATGNGGDVDWFSELGKQTNGILPMSGIFTQSARGFNDPNEQVAKRRQLTPAEYAALQRDPNWEIFSTIASRIFKDYPIATQMFPPEREQKDWIGSEIKRPLGLPLDDATPYMPVIKPKDPLYGWLFKHGLGMKPRPDGRISEGLPVPTTMSREQENTYRTAMRTLTGQESAAAVLGASSATVNVGTAVFSIDRYVQGRDLKQALNALRNDPEYNLELNTPGGPSLVTQPQSSLSTRTQRVNDPRGVYKVFDAVVSYYDQLGIRAMIQQHPEFADMARANLGTLQDNVRARLEASPIGIGRQ
jgi:hypothetical protein